jgi:hypothetical protein
MQNGRWGHCKNCKHFGSPAVQPLGAEEARCMEPTLSKFYLRVYGSNGCSGWELRPGLPTNIEMPRATMTPNAAPPP